MIYQQKALNQQSTKYTMKRILVLCTGNSCRSQIAHGYLQQIENFKQLGTGIFSVTVYAEKPVACCGPDCCN